MTSIWGLRKIWYHLRCTGCFKKFDIIWDSLGVSKSLISFEIHWVSQKNLISFEMRWVFQKIWYHLRCTGCFKKFDIFWYVLGVSEKLIAFCSLIPWPILIQMISIFNSLYSNHSKFYLKFKHLPHPTPVNGISIPEKKKKIINYKILSCFHIFC